MYFFSLLSHFSVSSFSFYLYFYSAFSRGNAIVTRKARFDYFTGVIRRIGMRMLVFFLRFGLNSRYTRFFFLGLFSFFVEFRFVFSIETKQFFPSFSKRSVLRGVVFVPFRCINKFGIDCSSIVKGLKTLETLRTTNKKSIFIKINYDVIIRNILMWMI